MLLGFSKCVITKTQNKTPGWTQPLPWEPLLQIQANLVSVLWTQHERQDMDGGKSTCPVVHFLHCFCQARVLCMVAGHYILPWAPQREGDYPARPPFNSGAEGISTKTPLCGAGGLNGISPHRVSAERKGLILPPSLSPHNTTTNSLGSFW